MRETESRDMKITIMRVLLLTLLLVVMSAVCRIAVASTTTTTISCAPTSISIGQQTGCTITVSGWTGSVAGESVVITMSSGTGNIASTSCTLPSSGTCVVDVTGTAVGTPTIEATYPGDPSNSNSAGFTTITIVQASTVAHVNCVPSSVNVGSATTCIVTIQNGYSPSGTVTWTTSGQGQFSPASSCSLSSATCSVNYTPTATGTAQLTATYGGDPNNIGSSSSYAVSGSQVQSVTIVSCSPQTVIVGSLTTCTATVTGYDPTGTVAWTNTGTGTFSASSCTLPGTSTSSCQVTYAPQSSGTITATYNGDSNNLGSFGTYQVNAIVNRYFQFSVDNVGPPTNITLSGCSVSPTTIVANGTAQLVQSTPGCGPITATIPSSTGNTRYVGPAGAMSFSISSCSSGSCEVFAATIYYQLQNIYQANPFHPSAWTTSGSITIVGTSAGTPATTICTIQVSGGGGPAVCEGWSDYKRQVSMTNFVISPTQRWSTVQAPYTDSTAGNSHNANYYFQMLEGFQYTLAGSTSAPSAPVLSYTAYGQSNSFTLQSTLTIVWLDSASTWTASQLLTGSTPSERWAAATNSGTVTAGQNVTVLYYHQYLETLAYAVVGGPSGSSPPAASVSVFGVQTKFQLTNQSARLSIWADAGKPFNFTDPLAGSTSTARWFAVTGSGMVSSSAVLAPSYYYQYTYSVGFVIVGGGQFVPPRFNFTEFGAQMTTPLTSAAASYWLDTGTPWIVSSTLPNSTATERWTTNQAATGTATSANSLVFRYYHQFLARVVYQVLGGGSPSPPPFNYSTIGVPSLMSLSNTTVSFWIDAGTAWHIPEYLNGSQPTERWTATSGTSGTVAGALNLSFAYQHQYFLTVSENTPLGGTFSNSTNWYDFGARVNLTALANGSWKFEYWKGVGLGAYNGTTAISSLSVSGAITETAIFYPGFSIAASQGGSVSYAYGSVRGVVKEGTSATLYLPLGENLSLVASPSSLLQVFHSWSGSSSSKAERISIDAQEPGTFTATFGVNYVGIAESGIAAAAVLVALFAYLRVRRKRIVVKRRIPPKRESWQ